MKKLLATSFILLITAGALAGCNTIAGASSTGRRELRFGLTVYCTMCGLGSNAWPALLSRQGFVEEGKQ